MSGEDRSSPVSEASLTTLLAALREQHAGAPPVAPLITRLADPAFRRPAVPGLDAAVKQAQRRRAAAATTTAAAPAVVIPVNLAELLPAARRPTPPAPADQADSTT